MPFGFNFGLSKQKTSSTATLDKTTDTSQNSLEEQLGLKSSNTATSSSGTTASQGTSNTTGSTTQTGTTAGTQAETSHTTSLPQDVLSGLAGAITSLLAGSTDAATGDRSTIQASLDRLKSFDPAKFLAESNLAAESRAHNDLEAGSNALFSRIGGTADTNSTAALLRNRMVNETDASLAGSRAQSEAMIADILGKNASVTSSALAPLDALLPGLAAILKGSDVVTTGQTQQQQTQQQTGAQASTTATAETGQQQQASQTTTVESLINLMSQLMSGTSHETGTETSKGKTSGMTFGLTASK